MKKKISKKMNRFGALNGMVGLVIAMNIPLIQDRKETVLKLYLSGGG